MIRVLDYGVSDLAVRLAETFHEHYPDCRVLVVQDTPGEDHVFALDDHNKPAFDLFASSSRKLAFLWYYVYPRRALALPEELKSAAGWGSVVRWDLRKGAGPVFITKKGSPQLEPGEFDDRALIAYRLYDWYTVPAAMDKILTRAKIMTVQRLRSHPEKIANIRGYCLYAGCAYTLVYPELSFGMRDIDVQVFFSPDWWTNMRSAFSRECEIEEFGRPELYFSGRTRTLDLMWNSFHIEQGSFADNVRRYIEEMRYKSDRWATMSQRPLIDLETKEVIYVPRWLERVAETL